MMLKAIELIGALAPAAGLVLLIRYRRRLRGALPWGLAGCTLAVIATLAGLVGEPIAMAAGGDWEHIEQRLALVSAVRTVLLLAAVMLLVFAAVRGREDAAAPIGWIIGGTAAAAVGLLLSLLHLDLGPDHERLTTIVGLLLETVRFALIGSGVLLLSFAIIVKRPPADDHRDPEALARSAGATVMKYVRERAASGNDRRR